MLSLSKLSLKKFGLLSFVFVAITLGSFLVSADCCTFQGSCTTTNSGCPQGYFVSGQSCSTLDACQVGCCCSQNLAMRKGACTQGSFFQNPSLVSGSTCSCSSKYSISGIVLLNGNPIAGASVSVGSIYNSSQSGSNAGKFTLYEVPEAQSVVVNALSSGCSGNATLSPFSSDASSVTINLVCPSACEPGCNVAGHSYCDAQRNLHFFDVALAQDKSEYCSYCADMDSAVCGTFSQCRAGDGSCPLGCTPSNDADCGCNPTVKNGYCPQGCASDADCVSISAPSCGDGLVSYPFETCEVNPAAGQISFCSSSGCNACNCVTSQTCGNGRIDPGESCELGNVCSDGSTCLGCQCGNSCSDIKKVPSLTLTYLKSVNQINLLWDVSAPCDSIVLSFEAWECKKDSTNNCLDLSTFTKIDSYTHQRNLTRAVLQKSTYSYVIKARYVDGTSGVSPISSITTGDPICLSRSPTDNSEFCIDNKRSRCDSNGNIATIENCQTQSKFCSGPDGNDATHCEANDVCKSCNGLYGMFGRYLDLKVISGSQILFCSPGIGRSVVSGCYYDQTKSIFKAYNSCSNIRSCYDYKSQDACTDPTDPCKRNVGCEWASFSSNPDLGGICRPLNPQNQDCTLCENPAYNWLSPVCTPETCGLFGTCYYQGTGNSPVCSSRQVSTCGSLTSSDACEGVSPNKVPVSVNAVYSGIQRIGGTHFVTRSNDVKGLGKCYWDGINSRCMRDADGLKANALTNIGFDCPLNNFLCESDFANPITRISNSQAGAYQAAPTIYYSVSDTFPSNRIKTYFCIAGQNAACYPKEQGSVSGSDLIYGASSLNASGRYTLYYYSSDPAQNLEIIQNISLIVDADAPFIELLSPRNLTEIALNTQTLSVLGRTSTDASFVCANNTFSRVAVCINNCQKRGVGSPCIDSQGQFNITISIAGAPPGTAAANITRNVQFYAQDYAGNRYYNTMLGILYDITPPSAPTIIIK